jgi:formylglycine-generating enzyme required for sulfatase activity
MKRLVVASIATAGLAACGAAAVRVIARPSREAGSREPISAQQEARQVLRDAAADASGPPFTADGGNTPQMIRIAGGTFLMGASWPQDPQTHDDNERPAHLVSVRAFEIDRTEVTVGDYGECVNAGRCKKQVFDSDIDDHCNGNRNDDRFDDPIDCVSLREATIYCASRGKRLPTEEEWEYAARGADGRKYPWGSVEYTQGDSVCTKRYDLGDHPGSCPVGSNAMDSSPFGVLDMAGNVSEWTSSRYRADYTTSDASSSHASRGWTDGEFVQRGGWWTTTGSGSLRTTQRFGRSAGDRDNVVGFRCAR